MTDEKQQAIPERHSCHLCGCLLTKHKCLSCGHEECSECPVHVPKPSYEELQTENVRLREQLEDQHPPCGKPWHSVCHCHTCGEIGKQPECMTCVAEAKVEQLQKRLAAATVPVSDEDKDAVMRWAKENGVVEATFEQGMNALLASRRED